MGVMSLTQGQFAREKADTLGCVRPAIDALRGFDTVDMFLVKRRWQIAPYVHRYPSPVGRLGQTPCQAPDFLHFGSTCYRVRRGSAQNALICASGWNWSAIRGVTASEAMICKGAEIWESSLLHPNAQSRFAHSWLWQPVATRLANKRFWAAQPAQGRPLSQMATRSPVRLSVQRPMSRIARRTRNAADTQITHNSRILTAGAPRLGGLFYAIATDLSAGQEKTDGKGLPCSTRS